MKTETLFALEEIETSGRLRAVNPDKVARLAESIKTLGLLNPIHVVASSDDMKVRLVAGAHRLQAVISLGWGEIEAFVLDGMDDLHQQLAEIDENLMRSELTATQQAEHLQRRQEIVHALKDMNAKESGQTSATLTGRGNTAFASETAASTGLSKSTINQSTRRAREVCQEARDLIRGTKLDTGAYLDRLVKQGRSDAEQVEYVQASLDVLRDDERAKELVEERKERERVAKERRQEAKAEACNYLFEKLGARDWSYLIDVIERAGGSLSADSLRSWEAPASKVA